jgi:hypothetical protein
VQATAAWCLIGFGSGIFLALVLTRPWRRCPPSTIVPPTYPVGSVPVGTSGLSRGVGWESTAPLPPVVDEAHPEVPAPTGLLVDIDHVVRFMDGSQRVVVDRTDRVVVDPEARLDDDWNPDD